MSYRTVHPPAAKELLEEDGDWIFVDVRSVEEFAAGHVPGAYNIPIAHAVPGVGMQPNPDFVATVKKHFGADAKLVLGCAMGGRSARACDALAREGFTELVNMHGGFSGARDAAGAVSEPGWEARGFPTATEAVEGRDYHALGSG